MNVLHLCAGNLYGGIERIVSGCAVDRDLSPEMSPRFATCFDGRLAAELDAIGTPCIRLGAVRVSRPHTLMGARRRLAETLDSERPQAAICHSPWTFGFAAPVLRRAGVATILWVHDRVSGHTWPERWAALSRPDATIANSHFTAASIPALYRSLPSTVVYAPVRRHPSIDDEDRSALRRSLGVTRDSTCVVLLASRMERWKGHEELLTTIANVTGDWHLWIAGAPQKPGEADYERRLRDLCASRGIAHRVEFLGERRDVPQLMQAADVHCQPNTQAEPFGLVFIEALHAALPVVTWEMGGAAEIVTSECGMLLPPYDRGALGTALERLIQDPGLRRALGSAGPARAATLCDPAAQLGRLAAIVRSVAS